MKSDLSRDTFDRAKHFTRVLMQQGRVTLDADHNEQAAILLHYLWTLAADIIGPQGGPKAHLGFGLSVTDGALTIGPGRYYVEGILVENEADLAYAAQHDYPLLLDDPFTHKTDLGGTPVRFLAYLDVWERHITPLEDATIREVALGGPDTCNRAKIVWQVRVADATAAGGAPPDCSTVLGPVRKPSTARLTARLDPGQQPLDPCVMPPDSKYRGAENQLYRVEIHTGRGGPRSLPGPATFKWSRDNGSVATAWLNTTGNDVIVANSRGFSAGDWVELSSDALELQGSPGTLVKLIKVEAGTLSVDPLSVPSGGSIAWDPKSLNPKVRRWDQHQTEDLPLAPDGAIPVSAAQTKWIDLEDGIQVMFGPDPDVAAGPAFYRTGDYWLIPARVATGQIEWPPNPTNPQLAASLPPRGIEHHYAPLGIVTWDGKTVHLGQDCRCEFNPLPCTVPTPEG